MGKVAITLDDLAPQIRYDGTWRRDQALGSLNNYFKSTVIGTKTSGDTATFAFNGTSIAVYGSKKSDHGTFTVNLDDNPPLSVSGTIASPLLGITQTLLFQAGNLDQAQPHTMVLTNTQDAWFDIDYIVYETLIGEEGDDVITTTVDDASGGIILNPVNTNVADPGGEGSWQTQHDANKQCFNTTRTATKIKGYMITVPFNGSSIQVFGGISTIHGMYGVSLDGGEQQKYNGSTSIQLGYLPRQQIFGASGLQEGPHEVVLTNLEGLWLDIDYAVYNSSRASATTSDPSSSSPVTSEKSTTPVAAIVASVVSVVAVAAIALGLFFFLRRRRRVNREERGHLVDMSSLDGDDGPVTFAAGGGSRPATAGSSAPQLVDLAPTPFMYPSDHRHSSLTSSDSHNGMLAVPMHHSQGPFSHQQQPSRLLSPSNETTTTNAFNRSDSTASASDHLPSRAPSTGLVAGAGAGRTKSGQVASAPPTSVGGERMNVFGREQDAGPMEGHAEDHRTSMLPPDYHQAIQPIERR